MQLTRPDVGSALPRLMLGARARAARYDPGTGLAAEREIRWADANVAILNMPFRILDLSDRFVDGAAAILHDAFRGRTEDWQDIPSARNEVLESLEEGRVSRVAVDDAENVIGWIGGIPMYASRVWEIHPLVVARSHRRNGVGRALVSDLESIVARKGALTLFAGSDDENGETSLSGADLYADVPAAIRDIRNLRGHPFELYQRIGFKIVGVMPDANGPGKPDIFLAKRVTP